MYIGPATTLVYSGFGFFSDLALNASETCPAVSPLVHSG